jgi:transcriptional regulator with XRE-family HTH domain
MTPNTSLRAIRIGLRLSQDELARAVQEAGAKLGRPNACNKRLVQRWESGEVTNPHPDTARALEAVTGLPITALGFAFPVPELGDVVKAAPGAGDFGVLSGIWLSRYEYHSSARDGDFVGLHYVALVQQGDRLQGRSLPGSSGSPLHLDLSVHHMVVTGTWTERTAPEGYYRGAVYHGAIQLLLDPTGRRMAGKWVGFGRRMDMNTGNWELVFRDGSLSKGALAKWDHRPDDDA